MFDLIEKKRRSQQVMTAVEDLPPLPKAVTDVLQLLRNPNSSTGDFERSIEKDPNIAGRVLKLANSSFYGQRCSVPTIRRAIVVIGTHALKSMVLAASVSNILNRKLPFYGYERRGLSNHSLACAFVSRYLASKHAQMPFDTASEMFTAGLLHDIGKTALGPVLDTYMNEWDSTPPQFEEKMVEVERRLLGIDHPEAGCRILRGWNLPDDVCELVGEHHSTHSSESRTDLKSLSVLKLADEMCITIGVGSEEGTEPDIDLLEGLADSAGITEMNVPELIETVDVLLKENASIFEEQ